MKPLSLFETMAGIVQTMLNESPSAVTWYRPAANLENAAGSVIPNGLHMKQRSDQPFLPFFLASGLWLR